MALAKLDPKTLKRRLDRLDSFIADCKPIIQHWVENRTDMTAAAERDYGALRQEFATMFREAKERFDAHSMIETFCREAHEHCSAQASFVGKLFAPNHGGDLAAVVLQSLPDVSMPGSETSKIFLGRASGTPICSRDQLIRLHDGLRELLSKQREFFVESLRKIEVFVEASGALHHGAWLTFWEEWKISRAMWSGDVSPSEVSESTIRRCRRHYDFLAWVIPDLNCCLAEKIRGREVHEYSMQAAAEERAVLSEALEKSVERTRREASELQRRHGFTDKTIAAAAAFFDRTKKLAEKLRAEMIEEGRAQLECPYCKGLLGETPHLDHIHPTSHGGLSKRDNLIF